MSGATTIMVAIAALRRSERSFWPASERLTIWLAMISSFGYRRLPNFANSRVKDTPPRCCDASALSWGGIPATSLGLRSDPLVERTIEGSDRDVR